MPAPGSFPFADRCKSHDQKHKNIKERLSARQRLRKMHAMPDIIQLIICKAHKEKDKHQHTRNFFLPGDSAVQHIQPYAVAHEKVEQYLYKLTYELIVNVVEEKCKGIAIADGDKRFIADFYKYGFVGIMLDWIDKGMQEDYHKIVMMMGTALDGNIARSIENFKQK